MFEVNHKLHSHSWKRKKDKKHTRPENTSIKNLNKIFFLSPQVLAQATVLVKKKNVAGGVWWFYLRRKCVCSTVAQIHFKLHNIRKSTFRSRICSTLHNAAHIH